MRVQEAPQLTTGEDPGPKYNVSAKTSAAQSRERTKIPQRGKPRYSEAQPQSTKQQAFETSPHIVPRTSDNHDQHGLGRACKKLNISDERRRLTEARAVGSASREEKRLENTRTKTKVRARAALNTERARELGGHTLLPLNVIGMLAGQARSRFRGESKCPTSDSQTEKAAEIFRSRGPGSGTLRLGQHALGRRALRTMNEGIVKKQCTVKMVGEIASTGNSLFIVILILGHFSSEFPQLGLVKFPLLSHILQKNQ